jgi:hypothetical protein
MHTPIDGWYYNEPVFALDGERFMNTLVNFTNAFIPFSKKIIPSWYGQEGILIFLNTMIAIFLMGVTIYWLRGNKAVLLFYITGIFILFLLNYLTGLDSCRHLGHYFIFWIGCIWIGLCSGTELTTLMRNTFLTFLIAGVLASVLSIQAELLRPYSNSGHVAAYLIRNGFADDIITGFPDYLISPIGAELHKPLYYLERQDYGTYIAWDTLRHNNELRKNYIEHLVSLAESTSKPIIFLINEPLKKQVNGVPQLITNAKLTADVQMKFLTQFTGALTDENYTVYLIQKTKI